MAYSFAMRVLCAGFVMSGILTLGFVKPDLDKDPVLNAYGLVNVCITFDYAPARQMMGVVWVFVCALIMLHAALFVQRLRVYYEPGSCIIKAGYIIGPLFTLMFSSMAISMITHPGESIVGHSVPYQVLILGTNIWWIFNAVVVHTWPNPLARNVVRYWWFTTFLFLLLSTIKIYVQYVLLIGHFQNWSDEQREVFLPAWFPKSLIDPLWMSLFIFYRCWHPLTFKRVLVQFSNGNDASDVGVTQIWGQTFGPEEAADVELKESRS